jgi:adenylosuccinate lyase
MADRLNRIMSKLEVDEAAMQRNLQMSAGAIAAEPLYLLFEKYGHTEAHELSKQLAHQALSENTPLVDVINQNEQAKQYWDKFTDGEKQIIQEPEKYYTGLAAQKAKAVAAIWKNRLA